MQASLDIRNNGGVAIWSFLTLASHATACRRRPCPGGAAAHACWPQFSVGQPRHMMDTGALPGHIPVLAAGVTQALAEVPSGLLVDATFGGGGHARMLLEALPQCRLLGLDRDPEAAPRADALRQAYGERFSFRAMNFGDLAQLPQEPLAGVLFDFGVSSFQLDDGARGFSFRVDAPADMRMDPSSGRSAADFLETASEEELVKAVRDFGEEPRWRAVVRAVISARGTGRLQRTASLAELVAEVAMVRGPRRSKIHPATKTFQGLRIAVNDELGAIEEALPVAFDRLLPGGVLAAISFHSLEDRIVKRWIKRWAGRPEHRFDATPQDERTRRAEMLWRKPLTAAEDELQHNPRARSAKLRAVRKLEIQD